MKFSLLSKIVIVFFALSAILLPYTANAASFRSGDRVTFPANETVNDDLYISAGDVNVESNVAGDLYISAGQARIVGNVEGDLMVTGGQVTVEGDVGDDIRVMGGTVTVRGNVGDDLLVAGGNTEIARGAVVNGETRSFAGQLTIAGTTGPVFASVGNLTLTGSSRINGDVNYQSNMRARVDSGSVITGSLNKKPLPVKTGSLAALSSLYLILSFVTTIVLGILFNLIFPVKIQQVTESWRRSFWLNVLYGFILCVTIPVAAVILLMTVIGIPLGIGALLAYAVLLYLGFLVGIIALGSWFENLLSRREKETPVSWISIVLGTIIYFLLYLIPIVGWVLVFLIHLGGIGVLFHYDWLIFKRYREEKVF